MSCQAEITKYFASYRVTEYVMSHRGERILCITQRDGLGRVKQRSQNTLPHTGLQSMLCHTEVKEYFASYRGMDNTASHRDERIHHTEGWTTLCHTKMKEFIIQRDGQHCVTQR